MAKKSVSRSAINIAKGLVKDVTLLERYLEQQPADAVDLLEECIRDGSKRLREAAFPLLAERDIRRAEMLALEQAALGERSKKAKERSERFAFLTEVATTACLERAEALGLEIETLYAHQLARAVDWMKRRLERERERGASAQWLQETSGVFTDSEDENAARDWLVSLIDAPATSPDERAALFTGLVESRYLPVVRRADLPASLLPAAAFACPSEECFDRLTPVLERMPLAQALDAFIGANMMWSETDERWFGYWVRRVDGVAAQRRLEALRALKDAARVNSLAPIHPLIDGAVFELLAELPWDEDNRRYFNSDDVWQLPAAADVMMKAVEHASRTYNEQGHRRLHGYLSPLHEHGRAEHVPTLEKHARHVASITGGSQAAAAWFGAAITAIRLRTRR